MGPRGNYKYVRIKANLIGLHASLFVKPWLTNSPANNYSSLHSTNLKIQKLLVTFSYVCKPIFPSVLEVTLFRIIQHWRNGTRMLWK